MQIWHSKKKFWIKRPEVLSNEMYNDKTMQNMEERKET